MPLGLDRLPPRNHEELAEEPEAIACGARELRSTPRPAALRLVAVCVGVPMVDRGSSGVFVADRRVVLLLDDDDLALAAAAGLLELLLLVDLEAADVVDVTDGRPGWLRIC